MRHLRFACLGLLLFFSLAVSADGGKSFWKNVRNEVKKHPELVKSYIDRLARMDTTLTYEQSVLAFYGQTYLFQDQEEKMVSTMTKLFMQDSLEAAFDTAYHILSINPLHIRALITSALILYQADSTFSYRAGSDDVSYFFKRAFYLLHIIAQTGDGTASHPYFVTKLSDEYDFLSYYLGVKNVRSQSIDMKMPCDILSVDGIKGNSESTNIYFEITRVLELEKKALGF